MRKFLVSSLELFSRIAIFLILLAGLINGVVDGGSSGGTTGAIVGGVVGFSMALVLCIVVFGGIFLLIDIADNTRRTAESIEALHRRETD